MPDGQFYGAIIWYHLMAPFYGMCVPGLSPQQLRLSRCAVFTVEAYVNRRQQNDALSMTRAGWRRAWKRIHRRGWHGRQPDDRSTRQDVTTFAMTTASSCCSSTTFSRRTPASTSLEPATNSAKCPAKLSSTSDVSCRTPVNKCVAPIGWDDKPPWR